MLASVGPKLACIKNRIASSRLPGLATVGAGAGVAGLAGLEFGLAVSPAAPPEPPQALKPAAKASAAIQPKLRPAIAGLAKLKE
jgi:hypothetical protein